MKARYKKYILDFKTPSGTSRGILRQKETWFLIVRDNDRSGIGECGLLKGLSVDDVPEYEAKLQWVCDHIQEGKDWLWEQLSEFPSIQFGVEQLFLSLSAKDPFLLFPSDFTEKESPISINGLVWMGKERFMHDQIQQKIAEGFGCIKMKIGAIDFETEYGLLEGIRGKYGAAEIELRVDANGAFTPEDAIHKLERLSKLDIHSIEQPIKQGQFDKMKLLCKETPLPIALDEELIGIFSITEKESLLRRIRPQYIILKPSLVGGFKGSLEWIELAEKHGISWWVTSALESNVGLSAIAQWTYTLKNKLPQGLGTGSLYTNNFESPLEVTDGAIWYRKSRQWEKNIISNLCI